MITTGLCEKEKTWGYVHTKWCIILIKYWCIDIVKYSKFHLINRNSIFFKKNVQKNGWTMQKKKNWMITCLVVMLLEKMPAKEVFRILPRNKWTVYDRAQPQQPQKGVAPSYPRADMMSRALGRTACLQSSEPTWCMFPGPGSKLHYTLCDWCHTCLFWCGTQYRLGNNWDEHFDN